MKKQTKDLIEKSITSPLTGETYRVYRTNNDINGNPRYLIWFGSLGLEKWESSDKTRKAGLKLYRGKDFGGGFVFSGFNLGNRIVDIEHSLGLYNIKADLESLLDFLKTKTSLRSGLCAEINNFFYSHKRLVIFNWLYENSKEFKKGYDCFGDIRTSRPFFFWPVRKVEPRVEWLKKKIAEL